MGPLEPLRPSALIVSPRSSTGLFEVDGFRARERCCFDPLGRGRLFSFPRGPRPFAGAYRDFSSLSIFWPAYDPELDPAFCRRALSSFFFTPTFRNAAFALPLFHLPPARADLCIGSYSLGAASPVTSSARLVSASCGVFCHLRPFAVVKGEALFFPDKLVTSSRGSRFSLSLP